jgi:hypothetical protein
MKILRTALLAAVSVAWIALSPTIASARGGGHHSSGHENLGGHDRRR